MNKTQIFTILLSVGAIAGGLGCFALSEYVTPAEIDASTVVIFEVSPPPSMAPITPAQFAGMFPDDKELAARLAETNKRMAIADAKHRIANELRKAS